MDTKTVLLVLIGWGFAGVVAGMLIGTIMWSNR